MFDDQIALPILAEPSEGIPPLIDDQSQLEVARQQLSTSSMPVALDTERAQGRRYGSGAYLVQVRKDNVGTFLIDSHQLPDLSLLQDALDTTWIFHAADQDLRCLIDLGLEAPNLFDTETAARLVGFRHFSLGALTEQILNISLKKTHQDEDWSRRPLPTSWLAYAALDVELLTELKLQLTERLEEAGRLEWAEQEFVYELANPVEPRPPSWRNLKGLGRLRSPRELAIAKELWITREEIGKTTDNAPGRVLSTRGIIDAAILQPKGRNALTGIDTFRRPLARQNMDAWWEAIKRAYELPTDQLPQRRRAEPGVIPAASTWKQSNPEGLTRLNEVRSIAASLGDALNLDPEIVLTPKVQRELAWEPLPGARRSKKALLQAVEARLDSSEARDWQKELFVEGLEKSAPDASRALQQGRR